MVGDGAARLVERGLAGIPVIVVEYGYAGRAPSALGADLTVAEFGRIPAARPHVRNRGASGDATW